LNYAVGQIGCPAGEFMTGRAPLQGNSAPEWPFSRLKPFRRDREHGSVSQLWSPDVAVNFALSAAKAHAKTVRRDTRLELEQAASSWRERRENDLKDMGVVIPLSEWLGHNNGPDILESLLFKGWRWRKVQEEAFAPPDAETGTRWARKAEELGLSYREYRLELLERGRHPTDEDARRIRAARPRRAEPTDV
jgi:hypothetical protein